MGVCSRVEVRQVSARGRVTQIVAFGAISIGTTALDFLIFNLLVFSNRVAPVVANTISYGAGIVASYALNRQITFAGGGRDKRSHELGLFVAINIVGLGLNNAAVGLATATAGESALLLNGAKLAAGALVWVFKFVGFKRWVYPTRSDTQEQT